MPGDVFEEAPLGLDLVDDAGNVWPEVSFIILATTLAGGAERLAWIPREDGVDMPAPCVTGEGAQVVPHRGRPERSGTPSICGGWSSGIRIGAMRIETGQISVHHSCDERGLGGGFDFNKAAGVKTRFCKLQAQIKPAISGTETKP